ncbi:MAG: hypothetical protein M0Q93_09245, partial [Terrimicrobiaceae bacterium]|nr:hypothetical protein [Terrimicrobiaceae bacterium]
WQDQVLGPAEDPLIAVDGKKLRHAGGVELVSAFGVKSGRRMGSVCTAAKSNEIPAASSQPRPLRMEKLEKISPSSPL